MHPFFVLGLFLVVDLPKYAQAGGGLRIVSDGGLKLASEVTILKSPSQPIFAKQFSVTFMETTHGPKPWGADVINDGSLHLDIVRGRQLWRHGKHQDDNWCQCSGINTGEECAILATTALDKAGAAYIMHKSSNHCCRLGDWAHGYGPIRPDWLQLTNASYKGQTKVGNRTCDKWAGGPPGDWFTMISDDWSLDDEGVPCAYEDHFNTAFRLLGMKHILTFDKSSYVVGPEKEDVYAVPQGMDCSAACPNTAGGWCTAR